MYIIQQAVGYNCFQHVYIVGNVFHVLHISPHPLGCTRAPAKTYQVARVITKVCQGLNKLGPYVVAWEEEVNSLQALGCPQLDGFINRIHAGFHVKLHVLKPAGAVTQKALGHGYAAPNPFPAHQAPQWRLS